MHMHFHSKFEHKGTVRRLPRFSGTRVMMMPIILGDLDSVPPSLAHYDTTLLKLFEYMDPRHYDKVGYLTIDEKLVRAGETHRRAGLHVDGVYDGKCGGWGGGGGGGGGWGSVGNGMLTVSSHAGCRAWLQSFEGEIGKDGECDAIADQCKQATIFEPNQVYWVDGLCVHESMPMRADVNRQFVRLSMPSTAPWFDGYTQNPFGIQPTGPILPRRPYMDTP